MSFQLSHVVIVLLVIIFLSQTTSIPAVGNWFYKRCTSVDSKLTLDTEYFTPLLDRNLEWYNDLGKNLLAVLPRLNDGHIKFKHDEPKPGNCTFTVREINESVDSRHLFNRPTVNDTVSIGNNNVPANSVEWIVGYIVLVTEISLLVGWLRQAFFVQGTKMTPLKDHGVLSRCFDIENVQSRSWWIERLQLIFTIFIIVHLILLPRNTDLSGVFGDESIGSEIRKYALGKENTPIFGEHCLLTDKSAKSEWFRSFQNKSRHSSRWIFEFEPTSRYGNKVECYPTLTSFGKYLNEVCDKTKLDSDRMVHEWARLQSFENFPKNAPVSAIRLSQSGFYYTGNGQEVECFICHLRNGSWSEDESVTQVHKRLSPECAYLKGEELLNIPINEKEHTDSKDEQVGASGGNDDMLSGACAGNVSRTSDVFDDETALLSFFIEESKYPSYVSEEERLNSFSGWPHSGSLAPEELADAGLYYTGNV